MPLYRIIIEGRNLLMNVDGQQDKYGFYTTRWIRAAEPNNAKQKATALVASELIAYKLNGVDDPVTLTVVEVGKMRWPFHRRGSGFSFFPETAEGAND